MEPDPETEPVVTLANIMAQLRLTAKVSDLENVAKKEDLVKLQSTVESHKVEILQLKEDLLTQSKRIQGLEEALGRQTARTLNRTRPVAPDVDVNQTRQDGGAHKVNNRVAERRRNLVFEGISVVTDPEIEAYILQLCTYLEIIAFPSDIEEIVTMNRRDRQSTRPPPLLVTFDQLHVRSALLRKKTKLSTSVDYKGVYINPDEPIEIRRNKATFRKIAFKARQDGKTVQFRDYWIQIDEQKYLISDLDKLPDQYKVTEQAATDKAESGGAEGGNKKTLPPDDKTSRKSKHPIQAQCKSED